MTSKATGFLSRWWGGVLNIGIDESTSVFDRKRTRLYNGSCVLAGIGCLGDIYWMLPHPLVLIPTLATICFFMIGIYLNSRKKYNVACHALVIWITGYFTYMGIVGGGNDATEMLLIISSVVGMMFFTEIRTLVTYFLISLICFGIVKYCNAKISPLVLFPEQHNLMVSNYVILFVLLFLGIFRLKWENIKQEILLGKRNEKLTEEMRRSNDLLLNILPEEVAEELKEKGSAEAKSFDEVTVMFTDFKGFTTIAEKLSAKELVAEIDYCFKGFDNIIHKYGIEKIKTIGDSYMAAGGLPVANKTHAKDMVNAALEIVKFMEAHKQQRAKEDKPVFEIRIGINSGHVVAGIVGVKKFAYDIWGDTVNLASRMESSGEPGKINISGSTYELVKNDFTCIHRGKIQAKNKGEVDMYFVG